MKCWQRYSEPHMIGIFADTRQRVPNQAGADSKASRLPLGGQVVWQQPRSLQVALAYNNALM